MVGRIITTGFTRLSMEYTYEGRLATFKCNKCGFVFDVQHYYRHLSEWEMDLAQDGLYTTEKLSCPHCIVLEKLQKRITGTDYASNEVFLK